MTNLPSITGADLAGKLREVLERVRQGHPTVVTDDGRDQVVMLDVLDFELLQAVARWRVEASAQGSVGEAVDNYLDEKISLGKAAQRLGISRYELMERFHRLGIPMSLGPATLKEARKEVRAALRFA